METQSSWMWMRGSYTWTFPKRRFRDAGGRGRRHSPLLREVTTGCITNTSYRRIAAPIWIFWLARAARPSLANATEQAGQQGSRSRRKCCLEANPVLILWQGFEDGGEVLLAVACRDGALEDFVSCCGRLKCQ